MEVMNSVKAKSRRPSVTRQVDLKKIMATGPNALWGVGGLQGGRGFWLNSRLYAHSGNLFDIQTGV